MSAAEDRSAGRGRLARWFWGPHAALALKVASAVFVIDQAHKWWMLLVYRIAEKGRVQITPFLDLVFVKNTGISYSMLDQSGQGWPRPVGVMKAGQFVQPDAQKRRTHACPKTHAHEVHPPGQLQAGTGQLRAGDQRAGAIQTAVEGHGIGKIEDHAAGTIGVQHLFVLHHSGVTVQPPESLNVGGQRRARRAGVEALQRG